jgi:hypothetical protein
LILHDASQENTRRENFRVRFCRGGLAADVRLLASGVPRYAFPGTFPDSCPILTHWGRQPSLRRNEFQIGSPDRGEFRTFWDINLIVGIPFSRWGAQPFVTRPFPYPVCCIEQLIQQPGCGDRTKKHVKHLIHLALEWQGQIENDPALTRAQIAAKQGVSRARVTQVMSLLALPSDVQSYLATLSDPQEIHFFSERRLRRLLCLQDLSARRKQWEETISEFKSVRV